MNTFDLDITLRLKQFFTEYLLQQRNCSMHTLRAYRDAIRLFLLYLYEHRKVALGRPKAQDFSAQNILDFLNAIQEKRHNGVSTRNARLTAVRAFVRYLLWVEPALSSDLQGVLAVPLKRTTRRVLDFLTREEMEAILDAPQARTWSGQRDRALFALMYNTGARVSEIVEAKVADLTLQPGTTLRLRGKGRKERVLPLWKSTARTLRRWIDANALREDQALFANARGAHMTRSGVEKRLREAVRTASETCPSLRTKRVSPHILRHTTAMHLLQSGVDITLIAMWLGHENIQTTHMYMTTDLEMKEKALKALQPPHGANFRFHPNKGLLTYLESI
jgi:site-specific recombinase XerD